ncbi:MAG: hypothetical protein ACK5UZ_00455, partial [Pseudanabaena sp.]
LLLFAVFITKTLKHKDADDGIFRNVAHLFLLWYMLVGASWNTVNVSFILPFWKINSTPCQSIGST